MKRALLVGINQYKLPGNDLNGCVNDVIAIRSLLTTSYGFGISDIRMLTNNVATKAAIQDGLEWLISAPPASTLAFHYSGHGTQIRDRDGDEVDHADECLCPHDISDESSLITDDWLAAILAKVPAGSKLYFVADCCHSGTLNRDLKIGNPHPRKAKYLQLPGHPVHLEGGPRRRNKDIDTVGTYLLLSGCRDNQTSADAWIGNKYHGALTYSMLHTLRLSPKVSWRELHGKMLAWLQRNQFEQVPQLTGPEQLVDGTIFE